MELIFDESMILKSIYMDYIDDLDAGDSINVVGWWILQSKSNLSTAIKELDKYDIDYTKGKEGFNTMYIRLTNGVYFAFDDEEEMIVMGKNKIESNSI